MKRVGILISVFLSQFALLAQGQQVRVERDLLGEKQVPADGSYSARPAFAIDGLQQAKEAGVVE